MAIVIGLTGGIGTGKTTISNLLHEKGAFIINADKIGHEVILNGQDAYYEIIKHFGNKILYPKTNEINRKALGKIVFSDKDQLSVLNDITHKYIKSSILQKIAKAKEDGYFLIILEMAILIEAKFQDLVDEVWLIYAPIKDRIERIIKRDNISLESAENIIKNQASFEYLYQFANQVIKNESLETAKNEINSILKKILQGE